MNQDILRKLPSIDQLMNSPQIARLADEYGRDVVVDAARREVDSLRSEILSGKATLSPEEVSVEGIVKRVEARLFEEFSPSLRYAINATGIILHTGLGRAVLAPKAIEQVNDAIRGCCTLAIDVETGQRASRDRHVSGLLCELTGVEAATIVNNNAAATLLILNTLAKGKEVIISRGQLVEIGGSFRMPDVMEASGAIMKEVGTTNKTHLGDYAAAINENTGAVIRVHRSNFRIVGFTEEPSIRELASLAREHNLPIIDDLGSGALVDLGRFGLEAEPMVRDSIEAGVDVACFSGDKLIGGPQCGIIIGKADIVSRINKNQLKRALRVGKMDVAALEATLRLFLNPARLTQEHPTYRMFSLTQDELEARAHPIAERLRGTLEGAAEVQVVNGTSQVGSGSVPAETLPTKLLSIRPENMSADALARRLRHGTPPVFARIHHDAVLFDFRTIQPSEDEIVERAITQTLA